MSCGLCKQDIHIHKSTWQDVIGGVGGRHNNTESVTATIRKADKFALAAPRPSKFRRVGSLLNIEY